MVSLLARKPLVIANWKMHFSPKEANEKVTQFLSSLKEQKFNLDVLEVALSPSSISLLQTRELIKTTQIKLAAQNCFWEGRGAFTGETSPWDLKEAGVSYVMVGHSERREYLKEDDEISHKKIAAILKAGLTPVYCVGESFEERQGNIKDYVIINHLSKAFEGIKLNDTQKIVIAYEPIWVIGSGQAVLPEEAEYTVQIMRQRMIDLYGSEIEKQQVSYIYGGSIDDKNIHKFVKNNISGVMVSAFSLKIENFINLLKTLYEVQNKS
jgi:triosephosphate isomerase